MSDEMKLQAFNKLRRMPNDALCDSMPSGFLSNITPLSDSQRIFSGPCSQRKRRRSELLLPCLQQTRLQNVFEENRRKEWMIPIFKKHGLKNPANTHYQFWQQGNYPVLLYSEKVIIQKLNYIHNNPVKAGLAFAPEEYYYSSAHQNSPLNLTMW